jgi:aldehyde:ferredoxin oxidoreductase
MEILQVNLAEKKLVRKPLREKEILGGRGLVDKVLVERNVALAHPLSDDNQLIIAPGLFAGTHVPTSGRLSVGAKSPLRGGIKEANVGGTAGHKLGRLGIQGVVIEGRSEQWQLLFITKKGVSFEAADDFVGLTNYAACEKIKERYGSKVSVILIGPAGEIKLANSTVASRHAARGGLGAVMGSKRLKAVIVDEGDAPPRRAAREDDFRTAVKELTNIIVNAPPTKMLNTMGTPWFVDMDNARGSLPSYNHRFGSFDKVSNINADAFLARIKVSGGSMGHGCMASCAIRCSNIYHDMNGQYLTSALEYETIVLLGSNLGIDDLDAIARMDRRCDELGLDTMEMGNVIGALNDVGLFKFGDAARAEELIEEIAKGTPMGRILGSGVVVTAKVFGISRVPAVKGLGLSGHSVRSLKGWGVTYATSPQGADHTAGSVLDDPLSPVGQSERSRNAQVHLAAFDCTGLCLFTFLGRNPVPIIPVINALFGVEWTTGDYLEMGREMLRKERSFNERAGFGRAADRLPYWMTQEPLAPTNAVFDVSEEDLDAVFNF